MADQASTAASLSTAAQAMIATNGQAMIATNGQADGGPGMSLEERRRRADKEDLARWQGLPERRPASRAAAALAPDRGLASAEAADAVLPDAAASDAAEAAWRTSVAYGSAGRSSAIDADGHSTRMADHLAREGSLGWTRPANRGEPTEVGARETKHVEHRVQAGDTLRWRVAVDAFDIGVSTSFTAAKGSSTDWQPEPLDAKVGGATPGSGDAMEGTFEARAGGVFTLKLDNSYSKLRGAWDQRALRSSPPVSGVLAPCVSLRSTLG